MKGGIVLRFLKPLLLLVFLSTYIFSASPVMVGADLTYKSQYIWRGIQFNGESVFWPDVWINWNELTLMCFGSVDVTDIRKLQGEFTEVDFYLEYSHTFKPLSLTLGYAHYSYPGHLKTLEGADFNYSILKGSGEFYSTLSTNLKVANLSASVWYDVLNAGGVYFNPAFTISHTIKDIFTPELKIGIGLADSDHNAHWIGLAQGGATDFTTNLTLALVLPGKLGNYLSIGTDLNYSKVLNRDIEKTLKSNDMETSNFWFGFTVNGYLSTAAKEDKKDE